MKAARLPGRPAAIIAIPACNEADRIEACLAALATQRDCCGAPVPAGLFEILVFANNCTDATVATVSRFGRNTNHGVHVIEEQLPREHANAGWARKRSMDLAATRLLEQERTDGVILTTDADSCVSPTWFVNTMAAFAEGADCVAGYIDANPAEMMRLDAAFVERGRLEDHYLRLIAEIDARCDPRPHDPWPNHRVSSGASLAVTLGAYVGIGGLPPRAVGEDAALTDVLDRSDYKVRHAMDVSVTTSCRFEGRVKGGAADTMKHRHAVPDAPCDDAMDAALPLTRRALYKGRLRRASTDRGAFHALLRKQLRMSEASAATIADMLSDHSFSDVWTAVEAESAVFQPHAVLRPSDLPRQIRRAEAILAVMRAGAKSVRAGKWNQPGPDDPLAA